MHLLTKVGCTGLAAHIPDMNGQPFCKTRIDRAKWEICDYQPDGMVICYHCRRAQVAKPCLVWQDRNAVSEPGGA